MQGILPNTLRSKQFKHDLPSLGIVIAELNRDFVVKILYSRNPLLYPNVEFTVRKDLCGLIDTHQASIILQSFSNDGQLVLYLIFYRYIFFYILNTSPQTSNFAYIFLILFSYYPYERHRLIAMHLNMKRIFLLSLNFYSYRHYLPCLTLSYYAYPILPQIFLSYSILLNTYPILPLAFYWLTFACICFHLS